MKAVIFDLWKTLVRIPVKNNPVREFLDKFGVSLDDSGQARFFASAFMLKRRSIQESVKDFLEEHGIKETPELVSEMISIMNREDFDNRKSEVYPDALPTLKKLKSEGIKTAILSNAIYVPRYHEAKYIPEEWHIGEYFDEAIFSFDTGVLKPDPITFITVLNKLKVKPEESIFVDDFPPNVSAAKELGMTGLLIDRGDRHDYPDKIVSLNEIFKFL